ncbi:MAG: glycosyltransferase family 1 protein [Gammaproteobacteria bacterium]|nr:glycosyltransferase family 1 protein [Gammaproteobacteria bacterium]
MKIVLVSDAWFPQINGVVTTLFKTKQELEKLGHHVITITPDHFKTIPCPTYSEIRLAIAPSKKVRELLKTFQADAVHIATEGPLGLAARAWCLKQNFPFTTSFHTRFPEYVKLRFHIPLALTYAFQRWFHGAAQYTMVATEALRQELTEKGFPNLVIWSRGVDTELFRPREKKLLTCPRPVFSYLGRVAVEKNIEAFLKLDLPGTKYVIGDGPDMSKLMQRYPEVIFAGFKTGEDLALHLAQADVFVFPSRTDTFGLVVIEALACGVPVAAYPVRGPADIIVSGEFGYLDEDLQNAAVKALSLDHVSCRAAALKYTWAACTQQFLSHLNHTQQAQAKAQTTMVATQDPTRVQP